MHVHVIQPEAAHVARVRVHRLPRPKAAAQHLACLLECGSRFLVFWWWSDLTRSRSRVCSRLLRSRCQPPVDARSALPGGKGRTALQRRKCSVQGWSSRTPAARWHRTKMPRSQAPKSLKVQLISASPWPPAARRLATAGRLLPHRRAAPDLRGVHPLDSPSRRKITVSATSLVHLSPCAPTSRREGFGHSPSHSRSVFSVEAPRSEPGYLATR